MNERLLRIGICSTYAPRACGLATFAADLEQALNGSAGIGTVSILRMTNDEDRLVRSPTGTQRPSSVLFEIHEPDVNSYKSAAVVANVSCDVVIVQHEFGIFGGADGQYVGDLMEALRVPIVLTLHTVLPSFSEGQLAALRRACELADVVTVFTPAARHLLVGQGLVDPKKIVIVPHGAPDVLYEADRAKSRRSLDLQQKFVLSTFGLISPGKGLELAIAALPAIVAEIPETVLVIAGRTHPGVHRHAGEDYRNSLIEQVEELGLGANVRFIDTFLPVEGIAELLGATDVFVTPYINLDQIVSGALTFALAAGCPVVSTDYRYARDQLGNGAGTIVRSRNPEEFADAVMKYARKSQAARDARAVAHKIGASMHWSTVGAVMAEVSGMLAAKASNSVPVREVKRSIHPARLLDAPAQVQDRKGSAPVIRFASSIGSIGEGGGVRTIERTRATGDSMNELKSSPSHASFSKVRPRHLERLVDDTGIVQHATGTVPLLSSGYCVDDVARLIPVACGLAKDRDYWEPVVARAVAFVGHAIADVPEGTGAGMHNFLGWDRRWLDAPHFGDHVGRAARGLAAVASDLRYRDVALPLLKRLLQEWPKRSPLHPNAYAILAQTEAPESSNPRILASMVADLLCAFDRSSTRSWLWFEDELRYDYALFPHALLSAGMATKNVSITDLGLRTLRWLDDICDDGDFYRFPGCLGLSSGGDVHASGDEQPLEALALAQVHACAYQLTNDPWHRARAVRAHEWFLGRNRRGVSMVDIDGGCFDGLEDMAPNRNQGAESTLAYCASRQLVAALPKHHEHPVHRMFSLHVSSGESRGIEELVSMRRF